MLILQTFVHTEHDLQKKMRNSYLFTTAGGVGISNMVEKLENQEYMGFESLCYES